MVEYILTRADSADTKALREEYYALRERAFSNEYGQGYYPSGADEFDSRHNTLFLLGIEDGKVVSGLRFIFHEAGTDAKLPLESLHPQFEIQNLLPHLHSRDLRYAEIGGLAVDPAPHLKDLHLGTAIHKEACDLIKGGKIGVDLVIGCPMPKMSTIALRASNETQVTAIAREDTCVILQGVPHIIIMFSPQPDFPFLSEEMKAAGIGTPPDVFIARVRAERTKDAKKGMTNPAAL